MLRIAVCDDNADQLKKEASLVWDYIRRFHEPMLIVMNFSSTALASALRSGDTYDIYLIRLHTAGLLPVRSATDGIVLGQLIADRTEKPQESVLIYLAEDRNRAYEAYAVHAARYLLLPLQTEELTEALSFASAHAVPGRRPPLVIRTKSGEISVPSDEILWAESLERTIVFHLTNSRTLTSLTIRSSFVTVMRPLLSLDHFVQCHKSYVVNLNAVISMEPGQFTVTGNVSVPISRSRFVGMKQRYLQWLTIRGAAEEQ